MEDPLSAVHDRPHRYLLESDSSDEEGQGIYGTTEPGPSTTKPKIQTTQPYSTQDVQISGGPWDGSEEVILGVGQAGRYLHRKLLGGAVDSKVVVRVRGEVLGSGFELGRRLLLCLEEGGPDSAHVVAQALLERSGRIPWVVVSTYLPSMYIPDRPLSLPTAPIRYLELEGDRSVDRKVEGAESITSPNYVTGLSAALLSKLSHPSTPRTKASLILLPLPLSSVPSSQLINTLTSLSSSSAAVALAKSKSAWSEDDDEPFAQAGMGMGKNRSRSSARGADVKREVDGMYM